MDRPLLHAVGSPETELSIVVPVYRSADCLRALIHAIERALDPRGVDYEVLLVNDGSPDRSWQVIQAICDGHPRVTGIDLRKNFGQDNAILTGLRFARGKTIAVMDDDLQHHPSDLPALMAALHDGADVVYAEFRVRHHRFWKNLGSWFNGKVAEWVLSKPRGIYLSPFKVMRREIAALACRYEGPDPYLDGLLFQVTSRFAQVPVNHYPRYAGRSNYTFWKSIALWLRLAASFSVKPLRMVTVCGLSLGVLGGILALFVIAYRLLYPERFAMATAGWASLMVAQLIIGGVQMVFLGILGEYAGRTRTTVGGKPQATIREVVNADQARAAQDSAELQVVSWGGGR